MAFNGGKGSAEIIPDLQASPIELPISIQGILLDENGKPVPNGSHDITFSIYNEALGVTRLWQDSLNLVSSGGLFDTLLGKSKPIAPYILNDLSETYLGVKVGNDSELDPRIRFAYAPYAIHAVASDGSDTLYGFDSSDFFKRVRFRHQGALRSQYLRTAHSHSVFWMKMV